MIASQPCGQLSSPTFFPRLKTHIPAGVSGLSAPHAAITLSAHVVVEVMASGVRGLVMKMSCSPRLRSYVCKLVPMLVVIWKVVLPRGSEQNGTLVGETRPTVCRYQQLRPRSRFETHTLYGANILDCRRDGGASLFEFSAAASFWRLTSGRVSSRA